MLYKILNRNITLKYLIDLFLVYAVQTHKQLKKPGLGLEVGDNNTSFLLILSK